MSAFSFLTWLKALAALGLFLVPGMLLLRFLAWDLIQGWAARFAAAFGLSASAWAVTLLWFRVIELPISKTGTRISFVVLAILLPGLLLLKRRPAGGIPITHTSMNHPHDLALITLAVFIGVFYLVRYLNLLAGTGVDSMHHTFFTDEILRTGMIPRNYGIYTNIVTFTYHFGYHAFATALSLISGITPRLTLLLTNGILMGMVCLVLGAIVQSLTKKLFPAIVAMLITGIIYLYPSFIIYWGRYPQFLGTILTAVWLLLLLRWRENGYKGLRMGVLLGIVSAGIFLTHYRILIATVILALAFLILDWKAIFADRAYLRLSFAGLLGLLLSAPWLLIYFSQQKLGFPIPTKPSEAAFFSFDRLGNEFDQELATFILAILFFLFILLNFRWKNKFIQIMTVWVALIALLSQPFLLGERMDPVSMMMSSFLPISLVLGIGLNELLECLKSQTIRAAINIATGTLVLAGVAAGVYRWTQIDPAGISFVKPGDIEAANWIKANTPPNAKFLISEYQYPFSESLIVGMDGGSWLPVLAQRVTSAYPMTYAIERTASPNDLQHNLEAYQISLEPDSAHSVEWMKDNGFEYYYLGLQRLAEISRESLQAAGYAPIYENQDVILFQLK